MQYYLRVPNGVKVPGRGGENPLAPGIECKCDGGYVVAPPSKAWDDNGKIKQYRWDDEYNLDTCMIPEMPGWLVKLAQNSNGQAKETVTTDEKGKLVIKSGGRDKTLTKWAGNFRHYGADPALMTDLLSVLNRRCNPPLKDNQVRKIAESIGKKPRGEKCTDAVVVNLDEVKTEPVHWLWPDRFALGKLSLIAGDAGLGKSYITASLAAYVSAGIPWPGIPDIENPAGKVIMLSAEDDVADTIKPRLQLMDADCKNVRAIQGVRYGEKERFFDLGNDLPVLEAVIQQTENVRLVIIDPVSAYIGTNKDGHSNTEVRGLLAPLSELAAKYKVAVLCVSHLNKGTGNALYRIIGSIAWAAAARTVWAVVSDEKETDDPILHSSRRLFLPVKNNLAKDVGTGLAFSISDLGVIWDPTPIATTAADHFEQQYDRGRRGPEAKARDTTAEWLESEMERGPIWSDALKLKAKRAGFGWRTIERARKDVDVIREQIRINDKSKWRWRLEGQDHDEPTRHE